MTRTPLVDARKRQQWSQQEVADRIGTTQHNVSRWERGATTPNSYFRTKLCALFGKSAEDLGLVLRNQAVAAHIRSEPAFTDRPISRYVSLEYPPWWSVPFLRNPLFTGREAILDHLHEHFHHQRTLTLTQSWAMSGLGGIGKTQIALEYTYRYRMDYQAVFWISAATSESLLAGFMRIAEVVPLPEQMQQSHTQVIAALKRWLATHEHWLLILDNVDDMALLSDFLPAECVGHLLITTRMQALGPLAQQLEVETMGIAEGTLLLLRRAKLLAPDALLEQADPALLEQAEALVIDMDFLPLALDQAGVYIEETGCSLTTYLQLYRLHRKALLQRCSQGMVQHPQSVVTTWSLSFQQIEQTSPAAADLLRLCAFLEPDTIPEELISTGRGMLSPALEEAAASALQLNEAIEQLRRFSLVRRDPAHNCLRIHRLVQAVLRDTMETEEQQYWAHIAIRATHRLFPTQITRETWSRCQLVLPQAQACSALMQEYVCAFQEAPSLLHRTAIYLQEHGLYEQAQTLCHQAVEGYQRLAEPHDLACASLFVQLGGLARKQGNYDDAEASLQHALHLCEHQGEAGQLQKAQIWKAMGNLVFDQGKYQQAESLYLEAIALLETLQETLDLARSLNGLGNAYQFQGKQQKAVASYQRAIYLWECELDGTVVERTHPLANLARSYYYQDRYQEAEQLITSAITLREQALGLAHPELICPLAFLGTMFVKQAKYAEAEGVFVRALSMGKLLLGSEHPLVASVLHELGKLYRDQGKYAEAEVAAQHAVAILAKALGPDHPDLALCLAALASIVLKQERKSEAAQLYQRALLIYERQPEIQSLEMAEILSDFARVQESWGNHQEAAALFEKAHMIHRHV